MTHFFMADFNPGGAIAGVPLIGRGVICDCKVGTVGVMKATVSVPGAGVRGAGVPRTGAPRAGVLVAAFNVTSINNIKKINIQHNKQFMQRLF